MVLWCAKVELLGRAGRSTEDMRESCWSIAPRDGALQGLFRRKDAFLGENTALCRAEEVRTCALRRTRGKVGVGGQEELEGKVLKGAWATHGLGNFGE